MKRVHSNSGSVLAVGLKNNRNIVAFARGVVRAGLENCPLAGRVSRRVASFSRMPTRIRARDARGATITRGVATRGGAGRGDEPLGNETHAAAI